MALDLAAADRAAAMRVAPVECRATSEPGSDRHVVVAKSGDSLRRIELRGADRRLTAAATVALAWAVWLDRVEAIEEARGGALDWGAPIEPPALPRDPTPVLDPFRIIGNARREGDAWIAETGINDERMQAHGACTTQDAAIVMATAHKWRIWANAWRRTGP